MRHKGARCAVDSGIKKRGGNKGGVRRTFWNWGSIGTGTKITMHCLPPPTSTSLAAVMCSSRSGALSLSEWTWRS